MEIQAQLNNLRIAPRKVRLVARALKGRDVLTAKQQLDHLAKRSARPLIKLLDSALANAKNNFGLVDSNLFVKDLIVNEGRKLKRFRPKGFGAVSPIEKKTSHIRVILDERVPGLKAAVQKKELKAEPAETVLAERPEIRQAETGLAEKKSSFARAKTLKEPKKKNIFGGIKGIGKRFFRRKAI